MDACGQNSPQEREKIKNKNVWTRTLNAQNDLRCVIGFGDARDFGKRVVFVRPSIDGRRNDTEYWQRRLDSVKRW